MEIEIKKVYEYMNQLRVEVEHQYGSENIGLSLKAKKLDPLTGEPQFISQVKELLEKKYGLVDKNKKITKKDVFKEHIGKKISVGGK